MIDSIEFHEEIMPEGMTWERAAPHLALLILWAHENNHLNQNFKEQKAFADQFTALVQGEESLSAFVVDALDGVLIKEYFAKNSREFVNEYLTLGVYYKDLEKYFDVSSIYELPDTVENLRSFYGVLTERYDLFNRDEGLPVYKLLTSMRNVDNHS